MIYSLTKLSAWDDLVSSGMNALLMPYIVFIAVLLAALFVAFLIMRQVADFIEEPLEFLTEKLYGWCNWLVAPARFLWSSVCRLADALVDGIVCLVLGKPGRNERQKEKWSSFFRGLPIVLMLVVIVAALLHQASIGRLTTFIGEAIDALPVSYFFSVAESLILGQGANFTWISVAEMLLCSVLSLVLMRRADEEKSTTLRYAYKLIFLLFTIVVVQYLPPQVYRLSDALWEFGATTYVYEGLAQFLLPWNMALLYFYLVVLSYAAREIVATLSFSVASILEPEETVTTRTKQVVSDVKLMANPTMAVVLLNVLLLIGRFLPTIPAWLLLAVEVVGTLICTIWYTNISTEKEAEIQEELDTDLVVWWDKREDKARDRENVVRYRVQSAQLVRLFREAQTSKGGMTPFGPCSTLTYEAVSKRRLRTCGPHCPYYRGKRKGYCARNYAPCRQYEFCVHLEREESLPPSPPDVEELRYRKDRRAFIGLLILACAPIIFLIVYAMANEWMVSLRV